MNKILPKIHNLKIFHNQKGIAHLGVVAALAAMLVGAAVIIYVNRDGTTTRENLTDRTEIDQIDDSNDSDDAEEEEDEDKGAYYVMFNDDVIQGTMGEEQPTTFRWETNNAWAQTCNGLYGRWEGTSYNVNSIITDAGTDTREGEAKFDFVLNEGDGKLSADKSTITIKQQVNCYYCEDPWFELTGKIVAGSKVPCK